MTNGWLLLASETAAPGTHHDVPTWVTVLFACLLAGMIAALAFEEKLHAKKSIIVGTFAGISLLLATMLHWGTRNYLESLYEPGHFLLPPCLKQVTQRT